MYPIEEKKVDPAEGKIAYDPALWQPREGGDYIHTLSGEIRQEDGFNFEATTTAGDGELRDAADDDGTYSSNNEWDGIITDVVAEGDAEGDVSQDALGDDFVAPQVKVSPSSSNGDAPDGESASGKTKASGKGKGKKR